MRTRLRVALLTALWLSALASPAQAIWRFDEIGPRRWDYNDEYFINVFNYRPRLTHRWQFRDAALGYAITAGSLRTDELYVEQRAIVRLPWGDQLHGQYAFEEWEDYDNRYQRSEVEILFRFMRPEFRVPLTSTLGWTPPADGLFFGGWGLLDADKEFADLGLIAGYAEERWGLRLEAFAPDFFFNGKNKEQGEYTSEPYTLGVRGWAKLLNDDLRVSLWFRDDLPLRVVLPERQGGLTFRYRQLRAGADLAWRASHDLRFDLEVWMERTRKRRRAPNDPDPFGTDDVNRQAMKIYAVGELDVGTLLEKPSRESDVVFFGVHVHLLDEVTKRLNAPLMKQTLHRYESYAEVGYVMALPSPSKNFTFGARLSASAGFLSWRDVRPEIFKHRVTEKLLVKASIGAEVTFFGDVGYGFFQFTFRADDQTFGGGNVQITMRF